MKGIIKQTKKKNCLCNMQPENCKLKKNIFLPLIVCKLI